MSGRLHCKRRARCETKHKSGAHCGHKHNRRCKCKKIIKLRGPRGPRGNQGITGLQGPAGATGTVGAAGAVGAQGPVGPAGPTGTAGADGTTILGYGSLFSNSTESSTSTQTAVPFDAFGPLSGITVGPDGDTLIVDTAGVYQFFATATVGTPGELGPDRVTFEGTVNGANFLDPDTTIFIVAQNTTGSVTALVALDAGDEIGLVTTSPLDPPGIAYSFRNLVLTRLA
ncbi:hypothetical protein [Paenibacillus sp. YIM B09110]|uniref:hypothetical protein n=1 Tax=Paenibacillus sp. YIM B09110 TaxID=3126102 RepID=UPI00301BC736